MFLRKEKGIVGRICHAIYSYAKTNNEYKKTISKTKNNHFIYIWMKTNYMDEQRCKDYLYIHINGLRTCLMKTSQMKI